MTWALLGSGLFGVSAVLTLALLLYKAQRETIATLDLLNDERKVSAEYKSGRDVEVAAHAVTSAELKEATQRLAIAEAQRNELMRNAAEHLKESDVHTVADVLVDSLAKPWVAVHGVPQVPNASHPSADNDLGDPAYLQPAAAAGSDKTSSGDGKS